MNQQAAVAGSLLGEHGRGGGIDQRCQLRLRLRFVDGGVCSGIQNDRRPQAGHNSAKLFRLRKIGLFASQGVELALTLKQRAQLRAQLTVRAEKQYAVRRTRYRHGKTSAVLKGLP